VVLLDGLIVIQILDPHATIFKIVNIGQLSLSTTFTSPDSKALAVNSKLSAGDLKLWRLNLELGRGEAIALGNSSLITSPSVMSIARPSSSDEAHFLHRGLRKLRSFASPLISWRCLECEGESSRLHTAITITLLERGIK